MDDIAVIIRNKNEANWIGHSIQSCLEFFNSPEIIVVDNKSTDESMEIVRSFRHDSSLTPDIRSYGEIKTINIEEYTPGKALNFAVKNVSKNNILILSAHAVITKIDNDFIQNKLNSFDCVFGKQIPVLRGKKIKPRYIWSHFTDKEEENMFSSLEDRYFIHNAFSFYKKSTLSDLPFDEEIQGKEDRLWAKALIDSGGKYLYTPRIECLHHYTLGGNTWISK
jgi:glycosyltransferase involved in cell wall biosynthesis